MHLNQHPTKKWMGVGLPAAPAPTRACPRSPSAPGRPAPPWAPARRRRRRPCRPSAAPSRSFMYMWVVPVSQSSVVVVVVVGSALVGSANAQHASKQARKQASAQASKRASKQARKQARTQARQRTPSLCSAATARAASGRMGSVSARASSGRPFTTTKMCAWPCSFCWSWWWWGIERIRE